MHSEPQQPDTETPSEKSPKFKNTKQSNGCLIAAFTVSLKAAGKKFATRNNTQIVGAISRFISFFSKESKTR